MAPPAEYVLTPGVRIDRSSPGRALTVHAGLGATRAAFPVEESLEDDLVRLLLRLRTPTAVPDVLDLITELLDVDEGAAHAVLKFLIDNEILLRTELARPLEECVRAWDGYGWKDPALFHLATYGQRFDPNSPSEPTMADSAAPPAETERVALTGSRQLRFSGGEMPVLSTQDVLARNRPGDPYRDHGITLEDAFTVVYPVLRPLGRARTVFGDVVFKSFPSGGARHPLEAYLVVKDVPDAPSGVYHLASATGALAMVADARLAQQIDSACALDRGVSSSNITVVLTCRWLRHMWKYRYSRSYRMILMELGHAVESVRQSATAHGLVAYQCRRVDDDKLAEICAVSDPLDEGPLAVLALGRNALADDEPR
jgi:SagB-type dehydrogenase family enzyme